MEYEQTGIWEDSPPTEVLQTIETHDPQDGLSPGKLNGIVNQLQDETYERPRDFDDWLLPVPDKIARETLSNGYQQTQNLVDQVADPNSQFWDTSEKMFDPIDDLWDRIDKFEDGLEDALNFPDRPPDPAQHWIPPGQSVPRPPGAPDFSEDEIEEMRRRFPDRPGLPNPPTNPTHLPAGSEIKIWRVDAPSFVSSSGSGTNFYWKPHPLFYGEEILVAEVPWSMDCSSYYAGNRFPDRLIEIIHLEEDAVVVEESSTSIGDTSGIMCGLFASGWLTHVGNHASRYKRLKIIGKQSESIYFNRQTFYKEDGHSTQREGPGAASDNLNITPPEEYYSRVTSFVSSGAFQANWSFYRIEIWCNGKPEPPPPPPQVDPPMSCCKCDSVDYNRIRKIIKEETRNANRIFHLFGGEEWFEGENDRPTPMQINLEANFLDGIKDVVDPASQNNKISEFPNLYQLWLRFGSALYSRIGLKFLPAEVHKSVWSLLQALDENFLGEQTTNLSFYPCQKKAFEALEAQDLGSIGGGLGDGEESLGGGTGGELVDPSSPSSGSPNVFVVRGKGFNYISNLITVLDQLSDQRFQALCGASDENDKVSRIYNILGGDLWFTRGPEQTIPSINASWEQYLNEIREKHWPPTMSGKGLTGRGDPCELKNLIELATMLAAIPYHRLGGFQYPVGVPEDISAKADSAFSQRTLLIPNEAEFKFWLVQQIDGLFGKWPVTVRVRDGESDEDVKELEFPNLAEGFAELMSLLIMNDNDIDIINDVVWKNNIEATKARIAATSASDWAKSNALFLGYKFKEEDKKELFSMDHEGKSISQALKPSEKKIKRIKFADKNDLGAFLYFLMEGSAIIRGIFGRPMPEKEDPLDGHKIKEELNPDWQPEDEDRSEQEWKDFVRELELPQGKRIDPLKPIPKLINLSDEEEDES